MVALVDSVTSKLPSALDADKKGERNEKVPSCNKTKAKSADKKERKKTALVIEDDIGPPYVLRRDVEHVDSAVIRRIPL